MALFAFRRPAKRSGRSFKDIVWAIAPTLLAVGVVAYLIVRYAEPAPPNHLVMSTGTTDSEYQTFAKRYKELLKDDGVQLELRPSSGANENLQRLMDANSDVDVAFVQDGLGTREEADDLESLGSMYYEPLWIFYRGPTEIKRFADLQGKRIAVGQTGDGVHDIALALLKEHEVDIKTSKILDLGWEDAAAALKKGEADVAFFSTTPEDEFIDEMLADPDNHLMNVDQAEAISRQLPYLHHLVLPHGVINLKKDIPSQDIHMLAPTAVLVVRDSLNPALMYLLLKAAASVHSDPAILEHKGEFPVDKDFVFPLSSEARSFYKSGAPFWQRYLPFWLATLLDRFILLIVPALALALPLLRLIPRVYHWRVKSRIFKCYGELKYLETFTRKDAEQGNRLEHLHELDKIEEKVNHLRVPLEYSEHIYSLRGHIDFVRERLQRKMPRAV